MKRFLATVCATLWVLPSALYAQGLGASQLILTNSSGGGVILQPDPAALPPLQPLLITPPPTAGHQLVYTPAWTLNRLVKWTNAAAPVLGNSLISDDGTTVEIGNGNLSITNTGTARELRLYEPFDGTNNYTAFRAQAQTSDITYTLPASLTPTSTVAAGILQTDGSGNLSWVTPAAVVAAGGAWLVGGNTFVGAPAVRVLGITSTNGDALALYTDNAERVRITAGGNVGIGTAMPAATLDVVGTAQVSGNTSVGGDLSVGGNGSVTGNLTVDGNTTLGDAATDVVVFTARVGSHVVPSADNTYDLGEDATPLRWRSGYFGTQVKVGASVSLVAATNELAYTGGDGRISVAGASALRVSTNGFERLRVEGSGDVVVQNQAAGTPTTVLRVLGGNGGAGATQVVLQAGAGQSGVNLLEWRDNLGNILGVIDADGLVGIGTATPVQKLHVEGNGSVSAVFVEGGVGVGTVNPLATLHVYDEGTLTLGATRVIIQAGANQSGVNLLEWWDNAGTVLGRIDDAGNLFVNTNTTLGDAAGDVVTVNAGTVALPNIPNNSAATEVLVWNGGNVQRRSAAGLISGFAWMLGGNDLTLLGEQKLGTQSNHDLPIITNNVERVRITAAGNVGIGTASPTALLHVAGTGRFDGNLTVDGNTTLGDAATDVVVFTARVGSHVVPSADNTYDLGEDATPLRWRSGYFGTQVKVGASVSLVAATNELAYTGGDGRISVAGASALRVSTNGFERLRVEGSGDVVVQNQAAGTPTTVLRVLGGNGGAGATQVVLQAGAGQSGVNLLEWRDNLGNILGVIDADGLVGIGTATPVQKLHVEGNGSVSAVFVEGGVGVGTVNPLATLHVYDEGTLTLGATRVIIQAGASQSGVNLLEWWDNAGTVLGRIDDAGNLFVNTNTTLGDAAGDVVTVNAGTVALPNIPNNSAATEVLVWNGGNVQRRSAAGLISGFAWMLGGNDLTLLGEQKLGTQSNHDLPIITNNVERVRITAAGNVGIGTASPTALLHVAGTGRFDGNLTVDGNTTLGDAATDVVVFTARVGSHVVPSADNTYDLGEDATPLRWRSGYFGTQVKVGASVSLVAATNELAYTGGDGRISVAGASALRVSTNGFERLRVEGSGDVVVQNQAAGTPTTVLRVLGGNGGAGATQVVLQAGAGQSGVNLLEWRDNLGNILGVIDADGLVGIGTATPVQKLHVEGNGSVSAVFVEGGVGVGTVNPLATLHVYDEGTLTLGATRVIIQAGASQSGVNLLEWWDNAGTVLGRIDDAGNLFVNTNTTLGDAAGDVVTVNAGTVALPNIPNNSAATEVLVWNGGNVQRRSAAGLISGFAWMLGGNDLTLLGEQKLGTQSNHDLPIITNNVERVRITAAGNVGIGTASPTALLHVAGTGRFDGNLTVDGNTTLGDAATDVVVFTARVGSHVVPSADNTYDLGEDATPLRWRSGYFGTQVKVGASVSLVAATNELAYTGGDGRISVAGASALRVSTNGFERLRVEGSGDVVVQNQAAGTPTTVLRVLGGNGGAGATQVVLQAGANQSGVDLLQWRNNSGDPLGVIRPEGSVVLVYDPPARQAFFAVANTSGVPLIGIGPDPSGWGVAVYEPTGPFGQLRAGMGKVGTEWWMGVGDLGAQNGVLLNWATTTTLNEPRIVVANGSLANPVFLVDREGDVTVRGTTVALPNIPSGSTATEVLVWNAGNVERRSAEGLAWLLTGNSGTNPAVNFLGTRDAQPLVIRTNNTERMRVTAGGNVGIGTTNPQARLHVEDGEIWLFNDGNNPRFVIGDDPTTGQYGWLQWDSNLDFFRIDHSSAPGDGLKLNGNFVSIGNLPVDQPLKVGLGTTEYMRVTTTGNVGIGTTTPAATLDVNGTVAFSATATLTNNGNPLTLPSNVAVVEIVDGAGAANINVNPPTTGTQGQVLFIRYSGTQNLTLVGVLPGGGNQTATAQFHAILMYIGGGWRLMSFVD